MSDPEGLLEMEDPPSDLLVDDSEDSVVGSVQLSAAEAAALVVEAPLGDDSWVASLDGEEAPEWDLASPERPQADARRAELTTIWSEDGDDSPSMLAQSEARAIRNPFDNVDESVEQLQLVESFGLGDDEFQGADVSMAEARFAEDEAACVEANLFQHQDERPESSSGSEWASPNSRDVSRNPSSIFAAKSGPMGPNLVSEDEPAPQQRPYWGTLVESPERGPTEPGPVITVTEPTPTSRESELGSRGSSGEPRSSLVDELATADNSVMDQSSFQSTLICPLARHLGRPTEKAENLMSTPLGASNEARLSIPLSAVPYRNTANCRPNRLSFGTDLSYAGGVPSEKRFDPIVEEDTEAGLSFIRRALAEQPSDAAASALMDITESQLEEPNIKQTGEAEKHPDNVTKSREAGTPRGGDTYTLGERSASSSARRQRTWTKEPAEGFHNLSLQETPNNDNAHPAPSSFSTRNASALRQLSNAQGDLAALDEAPPPPDFVKIKCDKSSLNFGRVGVGKTASREFRLRNAGDAPLRLQLLLRGPRELFELCAVESSVSLGGGQVAIPPHADLSCRLCFRPDLPIQVDCRLQFRSIDHPAQAAHLLPIAGRGVTKRAQPKPAIAPKPRGILTPTQRRPSPLLNSPVPPHSPPTKENAAPSKSGKVSPDSVVSVDSFLGPGQTVAESSLPLLIKSSCVCFGCVTVDSVVTEEVLIRNCGSENLQLRVYLKDLCPAFQLPSLVGPEQRSRVVELGPGVERLIQISFRPPTPGALETKLRLLDNASRRTFTMPIYGYGID